VSARCAVPFRASVRDLLTDLLGRKVAVADAEPFVLAPERPAMLATYRFDDGEMAAAAACDLPLAASAGAAIGMLPAGEFDAGGDRMDDELAEFFHEVVNVFAKLLNSPTTAHVVLRDVYPVPGDVRADVARLVLEPGGRLDYRVEVEGYGAGTMVLLTG
jgi:hypothetical protein